MLRTSKKNAPVTAVAAALVIEGEPAETNTHVGEPPMPDSVDQTTHENTAQSEFAEYMAEDFPDVKPGSALWQLYAKERAGEDLCFMKATEIVEKLFPDAAAPEWAEGAETRNYYTPSMSNWQSIPVRVPLRRESGHADEHVGFAPAHVSAALMQMMTSHEAYIQVDHTKEAIEGRGLERVNKMIMTLGEAAELAHGLLLLLDVALEGEVQK